MNARASSTNTVDEGSCERIWEYFSTAVRDIDGCGPYQPRMLPSRAMTRTWAALTATCFFGCATVPHGDVDELKPTIEAFHKCARWKDFQCIANLLVPSKRDAFLKAREAMKDERDLTISDYELEEAKVAGDRLKATA